MHQFPAYATGKIALSFKRSSAGTLKVVMVNAIVLLSKICGFCSVFLEVHCTKPNCLHYFFKVSRCSLTLPLAVFDGFSLILQQKYQKKLF